MIEKAQAIYNDYMENWNFKSRYQKRALKASITKLAKKIDVANEEHQKALMYLDVLAMYLDMKLVVN